MLQEAWLRKSSCISSNNKPSADSTFSDFFGRLSQHCFFQFWGCNCNRDRNKTKNRYQPVGDFQDPGWNETFGPHRLSVLGSQCLYFLPPKPFEAIDHLHVARLGRVQSIQLLHNVATLFPNLKALKLTEITEESISSQGPREILVLTDELKSSAWKLPLKSLSFEISPHFSQETWDILQYFRNLEVLEISSACHDLTPADYQPWEVFYGQVLEKIQLKLAALTCLTRVSLRFHLSPENSTKARNFLNQLVSLKSLSLYLRNTVYPETDIVSNFFAVLSNHVIEALATLRLPWLKEPGYLMDVFAALDSKNYFSKPCWKMSFLSTGRNDPGLIRIHCFGKNQLTLQMTQSSPCNWQNFYQDFEVAAPRYIPGAAHFNYALHQVENTHHWLLTGSPKYKLINDFENLNQQALFKPYFTRANWTSMGHLVCDDCQQLPRLLSDLPDFMKEAGIKPPDSHSPRETWIRTWTFCLVERKILAKWTLRLAAEITDLRPLAKKCNCERWDPVSRLKRARPASFADFQGTQDLELADRPEDELFSDSTLASFGNSEIRQELQDRIFKEKFEKMSESEREEHKRQYIEAVEVAMAQEQIAEPKFEKLELESDKSYLFTVRDS